MELHKILKERIKGGIFVTISNGTLAINIRGGRGVNYTKNINDISTRIENIADEIEYDYRKFVISKFLY